MSFPPGLLDDDKYLVLHKLGEGGMGTVWKVRHVLLDDERVVKLIRKHPAEDPTTVERFHHEAKTAIRLRHPGIAQLYDFSVAPDGTAVIVIEFIDGVTVLEFFKRHGTPELGLTLEIALQGLDALGYLHEMGYVHRDVSPDNLMLTRGRDGRPAVKLIDLGLAKDLASSLKLTETGTFLGKVRYSAPEQFGDEGVDARSDVYSFGVMLYELLTGVLPITGEHFSELVGGHLVRPPRDFAETDPEGRVPTDLRAVVMRTLEKDPAKRFASAAELARALEPFRLPYLSPFAGGSEVITPAGAPPAPAALETKAVDEPMRTAVTVKTGQPVVRPPEPESGRPRASRRAEASGRASRRALVLGALAGAAALAAGLIKMLGPPAELAPYRRGLMELEEKRWSEARKVLEAAEEIEGRERPELEPGAGEPYLPHYYLGLAYYNLTLYSEAWEQWHTSQEQGVIRGTAMREELRENLRDLLSSAIVQAESQLANARDHAGLVEPIVTGEDYAWFRGDAPDLVEDARALHRRLEQASLTLEEAKKDGRYVEVNEAEIEIRTVGKELLGLAERISDRLEAADSP